MSLLSFLFGTPKPAAPAIEKWRIDWRRDELRRHLEAAMWRHNTWIVASMILGHNLNREGKADLAKSVDKAKAELDEATRLSEDFKNLHG